MLDEIQNDQTKQCFCNIYCPILVNDLIKWPVKSFSSFKTLKPFKVIITIEEQFPFLWRTADFKDRATERASHEKSRTDPFILQRLLDLFRAGERM